MDTSKSKVLDRIADQASRKFIMEGEGEMDLCKIIKEACKEYAVLVVSYIYEIESDTTDRHNLKSMV